MAAQYIPPGLGLYHFNCPLCGASSQQEWANIQANFKRAGESSVGIDGLLSRCLACAGISVWKSDQLVWPLASGSPLAADSLPDDIRADYDEASSIYLLSPRGAAALLRLCVQKLCKHLGQPGKDLNADIGALVAAGLNPGIQRALDVVRVIGNEAVHPGEMDLRDDHATVTGLFLNVNLIADQMIGAPARVAAMYASLPPAKLAQIDSRDSAR